MTYRDDLEAARMLREALAHELGEVRSRMSEFEALARQAQALERELAQSARDLDQARSRVELPLLQQVRVASPCKERWDDMQGDERVRFCGRCEKNVYDLSALTASQAEALLREREGESMCVRFFRRSDGTILTADCPVGQRKRFWRRAATTAVASGLAAAGITAAMSGTLTQGGMVAPPLEERTAVGSCSGEGRTAAPEAEGSQMLGGMQTLQDWLSAREAELACLDQQIHDAEIRLEAARSVEGHGRAQLALDDLRAQAARIRAQLERIEARRVAPGERGEQPGRGRIEISEKCRKNPLDC